MRSLGALLCLLAMSSPFSPLARPASGEPGKCGDPAVPIHAIQGSGSTSPLRGDGGVAVEAIVVGDFQGFPDGLGGFFVQATTRDADSDPAASEGLFVFDNGSPVDVHVGDRVRARGEVREFFGLTELAVEEGVVRCGRAWLPRPTRIAWPSDSAQASAPRWEQYEGMRVSLDAELVATDLFDLARFGELDLAADGRLRAPTQLATPGAAAAELRERSERRRILLDDGSARRNPKPVPYLDLPDRGTRGTLRLGDRVVALEGVVDYAFGRYRIQPTRPVAFARASTRDKFPREVPGALRVAAWNVENHFNGDGAGGGFPTRGPANRFELERQRAKLVETLARIAAWGADIVGLVELENDGVGPGSAAYALVAELARREPSARYELVDPGVDALGTQAISVALLYRADRVALIGEPAVLDSTTHAGFDSSRNRPSLAASFRHRASGEAFTVVVNHWKSKGSSCASSGDPDRADGQGNCNGTRLAAARALVEWLANDPTGARAPGALVVGDLNAYPREDPLRELADAGFVDLLERFAGPQAYTFVFDGRAGRLDHALANPELIERIGGAAVWHTNADEAPSLDYREENEPQRYRPDPFRASDHDPVLIGLLPEHSSGSASTRSIKRGIALVRRMPKWGSHSRSLSSRRPAPHPMLRSSPSRPEASPKQCDIESAPRRSSGASAARP